MPSTFGHRLRKGADDSRFTTAPGQTKEPPDYASETEGLVQHAHGVPDTFSSTTTEILISEVEIICRLMPSSARQREHLAGDAGCERMPTPTAETLQILLSPTISRAPMFLDAFENAQRLVEFAAVPR